MDFKKYDDKFINTINANFSEEDQERRFDIKFPTKFSQDAG
jgi:hypothetical protein